MTKKGAELTTYGQEKKGADLTEKGADLTNSRHLNKKSENLLTFWASPSLLSFLTFYLVNISSGPRFPLGIFRLIDTQ